MDVAPSTIDWLLDSDPPLRWRVERDLAGAPPSVWQATRDRVATEGLGAQLLARQDADGQWAGGAYFPAGFFDDPANEKLEGQPYTATTWTLNTLRALGLDPAALAGTADKLEANSTWEYDDLPYWGGEVDCCINAFTLSNGVWLGRDMSALAAWFPEHQLADGGWNCEWVEGSTRSSFHSTVNSLKGLLYYEKHTGSSTRESRRRGEEYLLERKLLYRLSTGEVVGPWATRLAYPFRWPHTVLNTANYFRSASLLDGTPPDPRLAEAIELIRSRQQADGTWLQEHVYPGADWVDQDVPPGEPSKWVTFYATRVLQWWDANAEAAAPRGGRDIQPASN